MKITDVKVKKLPSDSRRPSKVRGIASVTFDGQFVVHNIKIVEGKGKLFVSMPSRRVGDQNKDIAHPITSEFRKELEDTILSHYNSI
ncbi:MAG: SpoVG family protein [Spirochaetia bacterium]|nr:SpoVG family protein [Spirochaetota bacterium]MCX8097263.1 SpoVG family protein [Spirochaetota bacterium]MDW8111871.1 SpoVG family protein [Spirochaetia bacterium]